jgi:transcription antitermination factor NusG
MSNPGEPMSFAPIRLAEVTAAPVIPEAPHWYAVYTYPQHEKAVAEQLEGRSVETFLPTLVSRRQWKDRKVEISRPLFPGYVFTRIAAKERIKVVSIPSVIRVLSFNGQPADISDQEIESIRICVRSGVGLEPHLFPEIGERVRVVSGAFEGVEGTVVNRKNNCKLVISINLIHQAVALEIDFKHLELLSPLASVCRLNERMLRQ